MTATTPTSTRWTQPWLVFVVALALILTLGVVVVARSSQAAATSSRARSGPFYYLSLGDSLAEGYQPIGTDGSETLMGYSNRVVTDLLAKHHHLTLENFGCSGATTGSLITSVGCNGGEANNAPQYPTMTQLAAALSFISSHAGQVRLITLSIGANDYYNCMYLPSPVDCVAADMPTMKTNLANLSGQLRAAVGPSVPIIGITDYVDDLGDWPSGPAGVATAKLWIPEFRTVIVPVLKSAYATSHSTLVNMVAASGAYTPLTKVVSYPPYGTIPVAVARLCTLTWVCVTNNGNEHPTNAGYALEAKQISATFLRLVK